MLCITLVGGVNILCRFPHSKGNRHDCKIVVHAPFFRDALTEEFEILSMYSSKTVAICLCLARDLCSLDNDIIISMVHLDF